MKQEERRRGCERRERPLERAPHDRRNDAYSCRRCGREHGWRNGERRANRLAGCAMHRVIRGRLVVRAVRVSHEGRDAGGVHGQDAHVTEDHKQAQREEERVSG